MVNPVIYRHDQKTLPLFPDHSAPGRFFQPQIDHPYAHEHSAQIEHSIRHDKHRSSVPGNPCGRPVRGRFRQRLGRHRDLSGFFQYPGHRLRGSLHLVAGRDRAERAGDGSDTGWRQLFGLHLVLRRGNRRLGPNRRWLCHADQQQLPTLHPRGWHGLYPHCDHRRHGLGQRRMVHHRLHLEPR